MRGAGSCAHMCCRSARQLSATSRECRVVAGACQGCPRRCARMPVLPCPDSRSGLKMRSLQNAFLALTLLALLALLAVLRLRAGGGLQSSICMQLRRGAGASASPPLFAGALHCLCSRAYWRTCRVSAAAREVPACAAFCLTLRRFFPLSLRRCGMRCFPLCPPPKPSLSPCLSVGLSLSLSLSRSLSEQLGVVSLTSALQISKCASASSCSACASALSGPASPPATASASVYNMSSKPSTPSPPALSECPTPPESVTPPPAPPPPSA